MSTKLGDHKKQSEVHAKMLLAEYYENFQKKHVATFSELSSEDCDDLKNSIDDILDDYYASWPHITIHDPHVIGGIAVYFAWKIGDWDWTWGWAQNKGGPTNNTIRTNLEDFANCASDGSSSYLIKRPDEAGEIQIELH